MRTDPDERRAVEFLATAAATIVAADQLIADPRVSRVEKAKTTALRDRLMAHIAEVSRNLSMLQNEGAP